MTLIKSISGMRGTIGGQIGQNLTAIDIVEFVGAYAQLVNEKNRAKKVVIGRDGRITGESIQALVTHTLVLMGIDVIDLGLSTTPTVEIAVTRHKAGGGIIITASHNPKEWNALKFLNDKGEFISSEEGSALLTCSENRSFEFAPVESIGTIEKISDSISYHIDKIISLPLVNKKAIHEQKYKIVVDCVNSTGAISIAPLLSALGCEYILLNEEITGHFAHNPEPLEHNLTELALAVKTHQAHMGIAVDPDVDRLAFVDENGKYCGEEYTLVMVAQWILDNTPGATVSNLSSTIGLRKITEAAGESYHAAAVGEVNVVTKMKNVNAVIGGEGNGGIIYPELHYGRDALVGIALILTALSKKKISLSEYRQQFEDYCMTKNKIELSPSIDVEDVLRQVKNTYKNEETDSQDGIKIYFGEGWVHLRKSNTEPIIRLYAEAKTKDQANTLTAKLMETINKII